MTYSYDGIPGLTADDVRSLVREEVIAQGYDDDEADEAEQEILAELHAWSAREADPSTAIFGGRDPFSPADVAQVLLAFRPAAVVVALAWWSVLGRDGWRARRELAALREARLRDGDPDPDVLRNLRQDLAMILGERDPRDRA